MCCFRIFSGSIPCGTNNCSLGRGLVQAVTLEKRTGQTSGHCLRDLDFAGHSSRAHDEYDVLGRPFCWVKLRLVRLPVHENLGCRRSGLAWKGHDG